MAFPAASFTEVFTVTVYVVASDWPLVRKIAWFVLQVRKVHPGMLDVMLTALTVEQSIFSFQ